MRFQKMICPAAFLLVAVVVFECPESIGQVLHPIQLPPQSRETDTSHEFGNGLDPSDSSRQEEAEPFKLSSRFHLQKGTKTGYLIVKIELPEGSYIYSLTQPAPLRPSKIKATKSNQFHMNGSFTPDTPPIVVEKDPIFEQRLEKHLNVVQFFTSVDIAPGVSPESLEAELVFSGQVCNEEGYCVPVFGAKTKGKFAGYYERTAEKRTNSQTESSFGNQPR